MLGISLTHAKQRCQSSCFYQSARLKFSASGSVSFLPGDVRSSHVMRRFDQRKARWEDKSRFHGRRCNDTTLAASRQLADGRMVSRSAGPSVYTCLCTLQVKKRGARTYKSNQYTLRSFSMEWGALSLVRISSTD